MVSGNAFLTVNDAVMKWMAAGYPVGQIVFLRGMFLLGLVATVAVGWSGPQALRVHNLRAQSLRALLTVASTWMFVGGLALMPLADAIAVTFAAPLFVTAFAPVALGEKVGWQRWLAVVAGFVGVVVMLRPGAALRWEVLLPLGAALTYGLAQIITRQLVATESSLGTMAFTMFSVTVVAALTAPFGWQTPTAGDVALLAVAGLLLGSSHLLVIEAFRWAEASVAAPFQYSAVVWAVLLGVVVWGDVPDIWIGSGATLVIASGLYIWHRETRL